MCCHFIIHNHKKHFQSLKSGFAACSRSFCPFKHWFSHLLAIHWRFIAFYWFSLVFQVYLINFRVQKILKFSPRNSTSLPKTPSKCPDLEKNSIFEKFSKNWRFLEKTSTNFKIFWEALELTSHVLHVLTNLYMIAFEVSV